MLGNIGKLFGRDKRTVVQRYTQDLSQVTGQIHALEKKLQRGQNTIDHLQLQLTTYGLAISGIVLAYGYLQNVFPKFGTLSRLSVIFIVCIVVLILVKWITTQIYDKYSNFEQKKLSKLKAAHQKKLNELKKETNYHETNSVIQRFSSGEDQTEDAMILIDDELKDKYTELQTLQSELDELKQKSGKAGLNKEEKDVWFDKIIGVIAGGNDFDNFPKPIICSNCQKHSGAYRISGKPLIYICPFCQYKIDTNTQEPQEQTIIEENTLTSNTDDKK